MDARRLEESRSREQILSSFPQIEGFQLIDQIGRGGMGEVFRARRKSDGSIVALKVIQSHLSDDQEFRTRFERESRIAASISDEHVVRIESVGETEAGTLYLAMELIEGSDLLGLIDLSGRLRPQNALPLLRDSAKGLDAVHAAGLIHRDLKPSNILVSTAKPAKAFLTDFGLAVGSSASTALTATGQFLGTLDYVAPEQIKGDPLDARTDIYGLGCVFFHALTGSPPFGNVDSTAKMWAHIHEEPPDIGADGDADLALLAEVFQRVLAKSPADRYLSAGDFALAFESALSGEAVTRKERFVGVGDAAGADTEVLRDGRPKSSWLTKRRWVLLAVAGVLASVLTATAILIASGGGQENPHQLTVPQAISTENPDLSGESGDASKASAAATAVSLGDEAVSGGAIIKVNEVGESPYVVYEGGVQSDITPQAKERKVDAGTGAAFFSVDTEVTNETMGPIDLTCAGPIDASVLNSDGQRFSPIKGLDQINGNPGCNDQLQPGFQDRMKWIFSVPADDEIVEFKFSDVSDFEVSQPPASVRLSD